MKTRKTN